jgi:hypothetical protein
MSGRKDFKSPSPNSGKDCAVHIPLLRDADYRNSDDRTPFLQAENSQLMIYKKICRCVATWEDTKKSAGHPANR